MKKIFLLPAVIAFAFTAIAQNVGIGTTTPLEKLSVLTNYGYGISHEANSIKLSTYIDAGGAYLGTMSNNPFHFYTNNGAAQMTLNTNGDIGIGTYWPLHRLHVTTATASANAIYGINNGSTDGTHWGPGGNFAGVHGEAASGSTQYQAGVYGYQIGSGTNSGGVVGAYSSGIWGGLGFTDGSGGRWGVYTPADLFAGGNVGIGATAPLAKLHLYSNSTITTPQLLLFENDNDYARIKFRNNNASSSWDIAGFLDATNANSRLNFWNSLGGDVMSLTGDGKVAIGTTTPATGYRLSVNGKIICTEAKVQLASSWPDYVFKKDYKLLPLDELEKQIKLLGHLPNIPSAAEIEKDGMELGDMVKRLMEKVEELTLYVIELKKENEQLKQK